jgi:hypothetical protein
MGGQMERAGTMVHSRGGLRRIMSRRVVLVSHEPCNSYADGQENHHAQSFTCKAGEPKAPGSG